MNTPQFIDYDRITDTIMYLSSNVVLNFVVVFSRKNRNNERMFYHSEYETGSRFVGSNISRSVRRFMTFYFVLDQKDDFGNGFVIKPQDTFMLDQIITSKLFPQLFGQNRVYRTIEDRLLIAEDVVEPVIYPQTASRFLKFIPSVLQYPDGTFKEAVRIYINSNSEFIEIEVDRFYGLYSLITKTDMYSAACVLSNYVKIPPYGINSYSSFGLGGGTKPPQDEWDDSNVGRQNNNFLDKVSKK